MDVQNIPKKAGIYKILNTVGGGMYIGSAINMNSRLKRHCKDLRSGCHHSVKLQRAYDKYHSQAFIASVVECVEDTSQLLQREQYWIDENQSFSIGYNIEKIAGSSLGVKRSEETRAKCSLARKGTKLTPEHKLAVAIAMKGRVITPEHRANISAATKGRVPTPETIAKMVAAKTGKKLAARSDEHCAALSKSLTGKKATEEHRANLSKSHQTPRPWRQGIPLSEGHRAKLSEAHKGQVISLEHRAKISAALKGKPKPEGFGKRVWESRRGASYV